ncbi:MAG: VWA domain-containing protein [Acidobacteriota bacterium]|nr:VWA domain-containing protein [Acidobacteriota bacterium]
MPFAALAQSGRRPQQKPGEPQTKPGEAPPLRIETREVVLPLMAYDAEGKFVDDLQTKDVIVVEEGEGRQVTRVKREPANIVLVMDCSNEFGTYKNAATEIYGKGERPIWEKGPSYKVITNPTTRQFASMFVSMISPEDQIAIIQYHDRVQLIQDWTNDRQQALNSLSSKYRVGIKSSYHDALKLAADKLQSQPNGRRIVVLITDGLDSNSKTGKSKAMLALEKSRASVFVVGWADALRKEVELAIGWKANHEPGGMNAAKRIEELRRYASMLEGALAELRVMAEVSGGELLLPATHNDLILSHRQVSREIGAQYSLSFITERTPTLEDKRSIQVIAARKGVSLRSRSSYYIPDEPNENRKATTR